jgi:hypothetical protein
VIDYSSPNVAADARRPPAEYDYRRRAGAAVPVPGHTVVADNHLGDWGTQFGMMLYGYKQFVDAETLKTDPVTEMARLYVEAQADQAGRGRGRGCGGAARSTPDELQQSRIVLCGTE